MRTANTLTLFIYNKCDFSSSLAEVVFKRNGYKSWFCIVLISISQNIGETKKKILTGTIDHQQERFKGKWDNSGATEHSLTCHG